MCKWNVKEAHSNHTVTLLLHTPITQVCAMEHAAAGR